MEIFVLESFKTKEAYVAVVSHCEQGFHVGFTLIEVGRLVGRKRLASKAH